MNREETQEKLERIFCKIFETEMSIYDEMTADNVDQWDSLSHMLMIAEVEEQFNIKFKLKELNKMNNVGSLINLIQEKTN